MTYRDLIFILCFVALAAWCWAGPLGNPEPQKTPLAESSPQTEKEQPRLPSKEKKERLVIPKLELRANEVSKLEDLVLHAKLGPRATNFNLEMMTSQTPKMRVAIRAGEEQWVFNSPLMSEESKIIAKDVSFDWEVSLSDLQPDRDTEALRALYGKKALTVTMEVFEADQNSNPLSRRVTLNILGMTSIPAYP